MSPNDGQTIIANDDSIVLMSPPLIDRRLKNNNSNDRTASSTPATSTSSSPYLQPSTPPHVPSGFALQLNDAISTADLEQQEDISNGNIVVSSSSIRNDAVIASPASQKSLRTHNPIRAIVDPIMAHSIQCGKERGDGKDQISLAVSSQHEFACLLSSMTCVMYFCIMCSQFNMPLTLLLSNKTAR